MRDHTHPATAFHAMALVAAARAAFHTARSIAERRAGRDPSAQEPEAQVRDDLAALADALGAQTVRLRVRAAVGTPASKAAALAQAFEDRLLLDDVARTLRTVHQKLLSLYPAVDETLVEDARQVGAEVGALAGAEAYADTLGALAGRTADLRDALADALR
jgi:hypothetical protein